MLMNRDEETLMAMIDGQCSPLALGIMTMAHRDQTDKTGAPYILHPLAVAVRVIDAGRPDLADAALLHDVVEDTSTTLADLRKLGVPEVTVAVVDALTRRDEETYWEYLDRVAASDDARVVKRADIADNADPRRGDFPGRASLMRRYRRALDALDSRQ